MTDAKCEPPPEWRNLQWHILESDREFWMGPPQPRAWQTPASWDAKAGAWWNNFDLAASSPAEAGIHGWRYVSPCTPPATVAALVEALEGLVMACELPGDHCEVEQALPAARAALAAYREAGR